MSDKDLLRALGLDSRTITIGVGEDVQIMLEKKIDVKVNRKMSKNSKSML